MSKKTYFNKASFSFLNGLAKNNNRDWFAENKTRFENDVRVPFQSLLTDLAAPLQQLAPSFVSDPKAQGGSLFRIYRDTRFSNNKLPYKTWAGARLYHQRGKHVEAPSFYIHIQAKNCFVGAGFWHPQPDTLKRVREFLINNPTTWIKLKKSAAFSKHFSMTGESLTRPPRGYEADHPLIDDIKRKDFVAFAEFSDELACSDGLLKHVSAEIKKLLPLVDYLCAAVDLEL